MDDHEKFDIDEIRESRADTIGKDRKQSNKTIKT